VNQQILADRLALLSFPASVSDIGSILFEGDNSRAAKWAAENAKAGHLERVGRGLYNLPEGKRSHPQQPSSPVPD
jgi:hypothetical protein